MAPPVNLQAALLYADRGWHVFPLRPRAKRPATAHGFQDATLDPDQIARWWKGTPNAGVGIATGKHSGIIVMDIDPRNGGNETFDALQAQYTIPETLEVRTGGGGRHLYFRHPGKKMLPSRHAWEGVDIQSDGSYVAAPFSVHPSGLQYRWVEGQDPDKGTIVDCPAFILEALRKHPTPKATIPIEGDITSGDRNNALTSLAGSMQRRGMSHPAILAALLTENDTRCKPPLPESEVEAIVASITRYEPDKEATDSVTSPQQREKVLRFMDVVQAASDDPPPIDWLVEDRIARGDCSLLVGAPASGKSFLTLDLALSAGAGRPIWGLFPAGRRRVLILDEENTQDLVWARIRMLTQGNGIHPDELAGQVQISAPCQGITFRDQAWMRTIAAQIEEFQPDIVVLDSIIAISSIEDESDAVQIRRFFHEKLYPLRSICGSTLLAIHHTTKEVYRRDQQQNVADAGIIRGSIDFSAVVDSALMVRRAPRVGHPDLRVIVPTKTRRGLEPPECYFELIEGTPKDPEGVGLHIVAHQGDGKEARRVSAAQKHQKAREHLLTSLSTAARQTHSWIVQMGEVEDLSSKIIERALNSLVDDELVKCMPGDGEPTYLLMPPTKKDL